MSVRLFLSPVHPWKARILVLLTSEDPATPGTVLRVQKEFRRRHAASLPPARCRLLGGGGQHALVPVGGPRGALPV